MIKKTLILLLWVTTFQLSAQTPEGGGAAAGGGGSSGAPYEAGLHTGFLLPNHIDGVTEIMALTGLRGAMRMPGDFLVEGGFVAGNGDEQQWKNIHIDARLDFPVETLVAVTYVGLDVNYYSGPGVSTKMAFGGHLGGGFKAELGRNLWFRTDMKFNGQPGTSLFFGFGLEVAFGSGGGGGGT